MSPDDKSLVWLHGEVRSRRSPRRLALPHSRPMPTIGRRCHELRIVDEGLTWRIVYRLDADAVILLAVFSKKTRATPRTVIDTCRRRLTDYDSLNH